MPKLNPTSVLQDKDILSTFLDIPFWIWQPCLHRIQYATEDGYCCFNHMLSLPRKDGVSYPLFGFQKIIFDMLEHNPNVWIKKARGLGLTTFILRYLTWKILFSSELDHKSIYVISGNVCNSNHKIDAMLKKLFEKRFPLLKLDSKFTDLWLKKTRIKILEPNDTVDFVTYDMAYLFIDEADFLDPSQQIRLEQEILSSSVRTNYKTIMVSTPNRRGSLFGKIENDKTSGFAKLHLDYKYGIGTIYDDKLIETKKLQPEFDREYKIIYK